MRWIRGVRFWRRLLPGKHESSARMLLVLGLSARFENRQTFNLNTRLHDSREGDLK